MRVTMRASVGLPGGEAVQPGQVVDVEDRIGQAWVEAGLAEAAEKAPPRKKDSGDRPEPEAPNTETQQAPNTTSARKPKKTESE